MLLINLILIILLLIFEFKTDYKIIKNVTIKPGTIIVCSHEYEHKDIFIMLQEITKYNNKYYILFADKYWNYLIEPFRPDNAEFVYIKGDTVNKLSNKLLLGYNIIIFLYKENKSNGIYHILNKTKAPLTLFKIKGDKNGFNHENSSYLKIMFLNKNINYSIKYQQINYNLNHTPKTFMKKLKNNLYS